MAHQKPKPSPIAAAISGFRSVSWIASASWDRVVESIVDALRWNSYLCDRTLAGRAEACKTVRAEISDLIPLGGDIDGAHAEQVARTAVKALTDSSQLTDRAVKRITEDA